MAKSTLASDMAVLERMLGRTSEPELATTPWAKARAVRDALASHDSIDDVLDELDRTIAPAPPAQEEVTKLPEVHDPAGDDLPFHIPAGKATQVLGTREIDPSRVPDQLNPLVTDSNGRALAPRSAVAREREALEVMKANEALTKLMRKWGVKRFSYSFSR